MPPKTKKLDPAVQAQQFETWKMSEEYSNWQELCQLKDEIPENMSTTTPDVTFDLDPFLVQLHRFAGLLKVPRKSHSYEQYNLRTSFFPQVGHDLLLKVDGYTFELHKEAVDSARDNRTTFCEVLNTLKTVKEADAVNFLSLKKDMVKRLVDFEKKYMAHSKKAHEYLSRDVLSVIIRDLYDAAEAESHLYYLQNRAHEKKKWFKDPAPAFRLSACKEKFAETMTSLIRKLNDHGPLNSAPDVLKSLAKCEIDTSEHLPLRFFVNPVKSSWRTVRKSLKALYQSGVNFFKQPLELNSEIVSGLGVLLSAESLADALLGDALKLDQLVFIYEVLSHVNNSRLKPLLDASDSLIVNVVAPELAVFKGLQQMYQVQEDIDRRKREFAEIGVVLNEHEPGEAFEGLKRLWVWEVYIRDSEKPLWVETSELISQVNLMVQEDLIDWLIARHLNARQPAPADKERRPPFVWNNLLMNNRYVKLETPMFTEEEAPAREEDEEQPLDPVPVLREYVDPEANYIDGRVGEIVENVETLARGLQGFQKEMWRRLVVKVIQAFVETMPESGEDDISLEEELTEEETHGPS